MKLTMKKIGMRTIKTSISVFMCIVILENFNIASPFYACIAAVICMQSSVFDSFTVGKHRMIGTSIGALIGFLFALISPGNPVLCLIGIICVIYTCTIFGRKKSVTIACIVFLAIMTNLSGRSPATYSTQRLIETFIGITISVLVNYFLFPPKFLNTLTNMKLHITKTISEELKDKIYNNLPINISHLDKQILSFENLIDSYCAEFTPKKNTNPKVEDFKHILMFFKKAYGHLCMIQSLKINYNLNKNNTCIINNLYKTHLKSHDYVSHELSIVYNYHVEKLIEILTTLENNTYN